MISDATVQPGSSKAQFQKFALVAAVLTLLFTFPLWKLFWFAVHDELYSYIPLMPFISAYLTWTFKNELPGNSAPLPRFGILFFAAGIGTAAGYLALNHSMAPVEDCLAVATIAWLFCLLAAGLWCLGWALMWSLAFPFGLLFFMIPFPVWVRGHIETALQQGSAAIADWMFVLAGMPVLQNGTQFRLPNISLEVAPECSGIHSTWMLLITSLVAGRLILLRPWKRTVLCLAVIPLAFLRNGFRVFVIGELCVHVGPQMIDSPIHHRGGPLFFVLSLVPFFLLLYFLRKSERGNAEASLK